MPEEFEIRSVTGPSTSNADSLRAGRVADCLFVGFSPDLKKVVLRVEIEGDVKQFALTADQADRLADSLRGNALKVRAPGEGDGIVEATRGDLGSCCACGEEGPSVRNVIALQLKASVPGTGWGCFVCDLPADGAVTVVCDRCIADQREPVYACDGHPAAKKRIRISELVGSHKHDPATHQGEMNDA